MRAAMTRCVVVIAQIDSQSKRGPMSAAKRARNRAPFSPLAGVCAALPAAAVGTGRNREDSWDQDGVQAPGQSPAGQDLSLFINTLKINRSGIILAFD